MEKVSVPTTFATRSYYLLTKPGIMAGNAITTAGGFALASRGGWDGWLFLATMVGLSCVIASACVLNNYIDRTADRKMARTKLRPLATGSVSEHGALLFAAVLGILGTVVLATYVHFLALMMSLVGFVVYVLLYSFSKYYSVHGTLIGSIAGAAPPVVGYTAAAERLDAGAWILFAMIALWQMPHFFSIAIYRLEDYAAASIPVLPLRKGIRATKLQMCWYIIAFFGATSLLYVFDYVGLLYWGISVLLSGGWLWLGLQGFQAQNDRTWAKKMFFFSLAVILPLSLLLGI